MTAEVHETPSLRALTLQSAKIGLLGFGGPAGQIALMHRIFVEEKKWIGEAQYLHALNYCMLLPGPEAQQLAVYVGWLLHGVRGGLIAGALFFLPGAAVMLALSWAYAAHADAPAVVALFYGVKAAVLAIVAEAVVRIGRRALKGETDLVIAAAAFIMLFFMGVPFPYVILTAAALGAVFARERVQDAAANGIAARTPATGNLAVTALAFLALWLAPLGAAFAFLGEEHVLTKIGVLFSQLAVVSFGGAYAVLAYLQQQAVETYGWLSAAQMIDGLGLAETTPGPLVLVNQFVGFLAGWNAGGGMVAGAAGAAMASWQTFAPSYFWIFAGAPFAEKLRRNRYAAGALRAVTAAVLGVVVSLAVWFALHVIFTETAGITMPAGNVIHAPVLASIDVFAAALAIIAAVGLIRFKWSLIAVLAGCAAASFARVFLLPA